MGVGGIGPGVGHLGAAQSTRSANMAASIGSTAFNTLMNVGTAAAGAFGGPAAASAVSSFRGAVSDGISQTGDQNAAVGQAVGDIQSQNKSNLSSAVNEQAEGQAFQLSMFRLQSAINSQSQTNNTISNMQKARHDAVMATIQNAR